MYQTLRHGVYDTGRALRRSARNVTQTEAFHLRPLPDRRCAEHPPNLQFLNFKEEMSHASQEKDYCG